VFELGADPIKFGLVASLSRPGGNMTGVALLNTELTGKRLDLLREIAPSATRVAFLTDPRVRDSEEQASVLLAEARTLGRQAIILEASNELDIDAAFATLVEHRAGALVVAPVAPLRNKDWVVYAKRPFGGPQEVLRYLARYTHRVAISNRRLISADDKGVTFKWKDYRLDGAERYNRVMTLDTSEFIRRFLMHVLPSGFHRIRYYGFLTCQTRANNIERIRELLAVPLIPVDAIKAASATASTRAQPEEPKAPEHPCPCCGSNMRISSLTTFVAIPDPGGF
jgi:hypothetical protein